MTKRVPIKTKTDKDILNEYIVRYQPSEADLMEAFGVSRQTIWNYKSGYPKPDIKRLANIARRADWIGDMAREMLALRGLTVLPGQPGRISPLVRPWAGRDPAQGKG